MTTHASIDAYIATFPTDVQAKLESVRRAIHAGAPDLDETIGYAIPAFARDGRSLVWFAGWKEHLSVYPIPAVDAELERELAPYRASKGTLRFPLRQPIPYPLIERVAAALLRRPAEPAR